jgi:hypothetical protein
MRAVTANARKFIVLVASLVVLAPALATLLDVGPMGYHDGTALVVRLVAVLLATASLAACIAIGAYIYWANVIAPAPRVTPARIAPAPHTRRA